VEACVGEAEEQSEAAQGYGCLDVLGAFFTCLNEESTCTAEGDFSTGDACDAEEERAEDCRKGRLSAWLDGGRRPPAVRNRGGASVCVDHA